MKRWIIFLLLGLLISVFWPGLVAKSNDKSNPVQDLIPPSNQEPLPLTIYHPVLFTRGLTPSLYGIETPFLPDSFGILKLHEAGAYYIRRNGIAWPEVEPEQGQRNWGVLSILDYEITQYSLHGWKVILIVKQTPTWAQKMPGSLCGPMKPETIGAFASFMHDLVTRYSQPPYNVKYWEIGNEPDVETNTVPGLQFFGCWGDLSDPYFGGGYYAEMLKQVYPAVKSADPQAKILMGGLLLDCNPDNPPDSGCLAGKFFEGILLGGGGAYLDWINFHAYDYYFNNGVYGNPKWNTGNTSISIPRAKYQYLKSVADRHNLVGKFYINSETALLCMNTCDDRFEQTKSEWLARVYPDAIVLGFKANIWYNLYYVWRSTGLITTANLTTPAYTAYARSNMELAGAQYLGEVSQPGVQGYEFQVPGRRVWVLWSSDGGTHPYYLPGTPYAVLDVAGNSLAPYSPLWITASPVYIRWVP